MLLLTGLLLLPGQIEVTDSADFSGKLQVRALTATVHIYNPKRKTEGSGVIIGKQGPFAYVLTAHHFIQDADQVEVAIFSEQSYPKADKVIRSAKVVAKAADHRDLALIRMVCDDKLLGSLPLCPLAELPNAEGFPALATGCTQGNEPTAAINKVLGKKQVRLKAGGDAAYFWVWNDAIAKGRSGGALVDKRGYVVGICSGTSEGKGYYTHIEEIHRFLKQNVFDWLAEKEKTAVPPKGTSQKSTYESLIQVKSKK